MYQGCFLMHVVWASDRGAACGRRKTAKSKKDRKHNRLLPSQSFQLSFHEVMTSFSFTQKTNLPSVLVLFAITSWIACITVLGLLSSAAVGSGYCSCITLSTISSTHDSTILTNKYYKFRCVFAYSNTDTALFFIKSIASWLTIISCTCNGATR